MKSREIKLSVEKWSEEKLRKEMKIEVMWREIKKRELKWSEEKWSKVNRRELKWSEEKWSKVKRSELKWSEKKLSEVWAAAVYLVSKCSLLGDVTLCSELFCLVYYVTHEPQRLEKTPKMETRTASHIFKTRLTLKGSDRPNVWSGFYSV